MTLFTTRSLPILVFALLGTVPAASAWPAHAPVRDRGVVAVSDPIECGWFVIMASGRDAAAISVVARDAGARAIDTNVVDTFTPDLYAAVLGPFPRARANGERSTAQADGWTDAYVKYGCEDL